MIFSDKGKDLLKHWEARNGKPNLEAYQDQKGVWTIGYGHTGPEVKSGVVWTPEQCELNFDSDCLKYESCVAKAIANAPVALTDNQFSALIIFCYNIGTMGFINSTACHYINLGRLDVVPQEMARWNKIRDQKTGKYIINDGLVHRRNKEIELWSKP